MGFAVRPDGRSRRTVPPATWPQGVPRTTHVDYLLRFVIDRKAIIKEAGCFRIEK